MTGIFSVQGSRAAGPLAWPEAAAQEVARFAVIQPLYPRIWLMGGSLRFVWDRTPPSCNGFLASSTASAMFLLSPDFAVRPLHATDPWRQHAAIHQLGHLRPALNE
jgi:hypothetical protein